MGRVIDDFRYELPDARIYVYDSDSSDDTAAIASEHGAIVRYEPRQGKGAVVRQMLRDIEADLYVMVDADDTNRAEDVHELLRPLVDGYADCVLGARLLSEDGGQEQYPRGFGDNLVRWLVRRTYGVEYLDPLTGYRAFNRVFAKTLPVLAGCSDPMAELSVYAADKRWRTMQVPTSYLQPMDEGQGTAAGPTGSASAGRTALTMLRDLRPLRFYGWLALLALVLAVLLAIPALRGVATTGAVSHVPAAVLAALLGLLGLLLLACGLVLDGEARASRRQWEVEVTRAYELDREWRARRRVVARRRAQREAAARGEGEAHPVEDQAERQDATEDEDDEDDAR